MEYFSEAAIHSVAFYIVNLSEEFDEEYRFAILCAAKKIILQFRD